LAMPTALITGATSGIGRVTALTLAQQGWQIVACGRPSPASEALLTEINSINPGGAWLDLDLSDLRSVETAAAAYRAGGWPLDALILNAGVGGYRGVTAQGFEWAFGVNHLAHFWLTMELMSVIKAQPAARVVTVASRAHRMAPLGMDYTRVLGPTRSRTGAYEYAMSKLANILFNQALARRLAGSPAVCFALHPGVIASGFWRHAPGWFQGMLGWLPLKTSEEGARTTLHCVLQAKPAESGYYFSDCRVTQPLPVARSVEAAETLWAKSLEFCKGE